MKRFGLLGVGLLVVFAALAAMSAAAFAVQPSNLPNNVPKKFTGAAEGTTVYHSAEGNIECATATGSGEETANEPPSGTFKIDFASCKGPLATTCTGLGEASGVILVAGTWSLVFDREIGGTFKELTTATLFNAAEVHFSCGALILIKTRGEVICLDLKATEAKAVHSYHCIGKNATEPAEQWCMGGEVSEACTGEWLTPKLEESINEGAFKPSTQLGLGNTKYEEKEKELVVTGMV
jgi:hypothetical protein